MGVYVFVFIYCKLNKLLVIFLIIFLILSFLEGDFDEVEMNYDVLLVEVS